MDGTQPFTENMTMSGPKTKKMDALIKRYDALQDAKGTVSVKVRAVYMDLTAAWSDAQLNWIKSHNNKVVDGKMVRCKGEGRKLFRPTGAPLVLRDEEFNLVQA
jgi:hypothetical protein